MNTDPIRVGIIFGLVLALFHAAWAALVAAGWAQSVIDFVFWAHFIAPAYRVEPFALDRAFALLGFVFLTGLVVGTAGGWVWNRVAAR